MLHIINCSRYSFPDTQQLSIRVTVEPVKSKGGEGGGGVKVLFVVQNHELLRLQFNDKVKRTDHSFVTHAHTNTHKRAYTDFD